MTYTFVTHVLLGGYKILIINKKYLTFQLSGSNIYSYIADFVLGYALAPGDNRGFLRLFS